MKTGTCIHFNGIQNNKCDAGISYDSVRDMDGQPCLIPCLRTLAEKHSAKSKMPIGKCGQYLDPTPEQIAKYQAEIKEALERQMKVMPLVASLKATHKDKGYSGVHECPACGGKLHIGIASINNHSRGRCETAGCVAWIE